MKTSFWCTLVFILKIVFCRLKQIWSLFSIFWAQLKSAWLEAIRQSAFIVCPFLLTAKRELIFNLLNFYWNMRKRSDSLHVTIYSILSLVFVKLQNFAILLHIMFCHLHQVHCKQWTTSLKYNDTLTREKKLFETCLKKCDQDILFKSSADSQEQNVTFWFSLPSWFSASFSTSLIGSLLVSRVPTNSEHDLKSNFRSFLLTICSMHQPGNILFRSKELLFSSSNLLELIPQTQYLLKLCWQWAAFNSNIWLRDGILKKHK